MRFDADFDLDNEPNVYDMVRMGFAPRFGYFVE